MAIYNLLGVARPFDPLDRYTTSWLLSPILLAALRLLLSLYAFVTIFVVFGWNGSHKYSQSSRRSFSYFTDLTYWAIAFYFLFSGLHTLTYATTGISWLKKWPRSLQAAHAIFYTTIVTYPFLVTIVYWVILYKSPWFPLVFNAWSNVRREAAPGHHIFRTNLGIVDIKTCPQFRHGSIRNPHSLHRYSITFASSCPCLYPRSLSRSCVRNQGYARILHVRLSRPSQREREGGRIRLRYTLGNRHHIRIGLRNYLGPKVADRTSIAQKRHSLIQNEDTEFRY